MREISKNKIKFQLQQKDAPKASEGESMLAKIYFHILDQKSIYLFYT